MGGRAYCAGHLHLAAAAGNNNAVAQTLPLKLNLAGISNLQSEPPALISAAVDKAEAEAAIEEDSDSQFVPFPEQPSIRSPTTQLPPHSQFPPRSRIVSADSNTNSPAPTSSSTGVTAASDVPSLFSHTFSAQPPLMLLLGDGHEPQSYNYDYDSDDNYGGTNADIEFSGSSFNEDQSSILSPPAKNKTNNVSPAPLAPPSEVALQSSTSPHIPINKKMIPIMPTLDGKTLAPPITRTSQPHHALDASEDWARTLNLPSRPGSGNVALLTRSRNDEIAPSVEPITSIA